MPFPAYAPIPKEFAPSPDQELARVYVPEHILNKVTASITQEATLSEDRLDSILTDVENTAKGSLRISDDQKLAIVEDLQSKGILSIETQQDSDNQLVFSVLNPRQDTHSARNGAKELRKASAAARAASGKEKANFHLGRLFLGETAARGARVVVEKIKSTQEPEQAAKKVATKSSESPSRTLEEWRNNRVTELVTNSALASKQGETSPREMSAAEQYANREWMDKAVVAVYKALETQITKEADTMTPERAGELRAALVQTIASDQLAHDYPGEDHSEASAQLAATLQRYYTSRGGKQAIEDYRDLERQVNAAKKRGERETKTAKPQKAKSPI